MRIRFRRMSVFTGGRSRNQWSKWYNRRTSWSRRPKRSWASSSSAPNSIWEPDSRQACSALSAETTKWLLNFTSSKDTPTTSYSVVIVIRESVIVLKRWPISCSAHTFFEEHNENNALFQCKILKMFQILCSLFILIYMSSLVIYHISHLSSC